MVEEDGRVSLIDIGTLDRIRDGSIRVYGGIDHLTRDSVVFGDAAAEKFDAIVLATGFRPDLRRLMPDVADVLNERGMPLVSGRATNAPGLYFCGQIAPPTGQLREIGLEARRIAEDASRYLASRPHFAAGTVGRIESKAQSAAAHQVATRLMARREAPTRSVGHG
jgi:pyruvate/2-oxoglutarate dehydrogenase complex dihydrolipoamide dehydrogenase (E3) component